MNGNINSGFRSDRFIVRSEAFFLTFKNWLSRWFQSNKHSKYQKFNIIGPLEANVFAKVWSEIEHNKVPCSLTRKNMKLLLLSYICISSYRTIYSTWGIDLNNVHIFEQNFSFFYTTHKIKKTAEWLRTKLVVSVFN